MAEEKKLFLLDGFALIYRAYFAFIKNPRINSAGLNTSAMYGFSNLLWDIIQKQKPTHMAVVFDPEEAPSERKATFIEYKANREAMPEDIRKSLPYIKQILEGFNLPLLVVEGYEADDVVGTLAVKAEKEGFTTYMMTSDKDYAQMVSDKILWYKPGRMGNPDETLGPKEVCKKFDIKHPKQVIDLLGMMGDSADNIPGIPGVGPKTAVKFIQKYGSVEGLLDNIDDLTGKMKEKVEENRELAIISKSLATIILDVPIEFEPDTLLLNPINKDKLRSLFAELEFRQLTERILQEKLQVSTQNATAEQGSLFDALEEQTSQKESENTEFKTIADTNHQYFLVNDANWRKDLLEDLCKQKTVCIDTETTALNPHEAEIVGISFAYNTGQAFYVPLTDSRAEAIKILKEFMPFFQNEKIEKTGQNIKYDLLVLYNYGIAINGPIFDTMIAHFILHPELKQNMDFLAETYLQYRPIATAQLIGKKGKDQKSMRDLPVKQVAEYCNEDTDITLQLSKEFSPKLKATKGDKLFSEVEMPLIPVLLAMETAGVCIDTDALNEMSVKYAVDIKNLNAEIQEIAGEQFNTASPRQLGDVLFGKMQLDTKAKKTKTGQYSTSEDTLRKLKGKHPIIDKILALRQAQKLKSTYIDALPAIINKNTGRIHTSFNQAIAATGRLSSNNPNLQNIPVRTEQGQQIRKAFIAGSKDFTLLSADYSQVELRLIADFGNAENMQQDFKDGKDIHTATAARVFKVKESEVDKAMRSKAKMVNFGIIYGISAFGLSQRLGIPKKEAAEIIENYFLQYPGIREYMDAQINRAREFGYVETLMGRRRYLRDINSANFTVRGFAERNAINAPIQGSAADIIKLAMIAIHKEMQTKKMQSKMVLQVHDELVFEAHKNELEPLKAMVKSKMENAYATKVPLIVEMGVANNWLEAH